MKRIAVVLWCLAVAIAVAAPAFSLDKVSKPGTYVVRSPNHTQVLGGKSETAYRGLGQASSRSPAVEPGKQVK